MSRAPVAKAPRTEHVCQECGFRTPRWLGRCPECNAWAALIEEAPQPERTVRAAGSASGKPVPIGEVEMDQQARMSTGIGEFDRALGGGLVPGAAVLLAGDPGIGKSTLLLSALDRLARGNERPVLYVSGEESMRQIRLRGERLQALSPRLLLMSETDAGLALMAAADTQPSVLAIDSVQTLAASDLTSAAGSVSQVRELAARFVTYAKRTGTPVLIVGHVTKDGSIAGPRVLEHMVDTVLYFEGDRSHEYRVLRAHKNRFGSTNEIGVFEMKAEGLVEVPNPSALFLAERPKAAPGSAVSASLNGTRPLLVEVQALVADSGGPGAARRGAIGVDPGRLALLTAVLEKKEGLVLSDKDLYVSITGGAELHEPAGDLAIVAALCSSVRNAALDSQTLILGEVGLAGEVRAVSQIEPRLQEAAQLGFTRCIIPQGNAKRLSKAPLEVVGAATLSEALDRLLA
ncbi:MAG: DNA repair protein RadA [Deltaproteobacteria bacterium]|nr:DNA repair protein RadA [Deltaproteobacteria bacterium]